MGEMPDWTVWVLAAAVVALFGWYFWHVGRSMVSGMIAAVQTIQNWPQTRRAMVEAEARAGGRYPLWYRAARVLSVLSIAGLVAFMIYRRLQ